MIGSAQCGTFCWRSRSLLPLNMTADGSNPEKTAGNDFLALPMFHSAMGDAG
jgi:hypothetical protein